MLPVPVFSVQFTCRHCYGTEYNKLITLQASHVGEDEYNVLLCAVTAKVHRAALSIYSSSTFTPRVLQGYNNLIFFVCITIWKVVLNCYGSIIQTRW